MLNWNDYPTISEIDGVEIVLGHVEGENAPLKDYEKGDVIRTIEGLKEDEYAVIDGYEILPYKPKKFRNDGQKTYKPAEFMKRGPELKIRVVDKPARTHIEKELKRFNFDWPKRGYKWTNPRNRTSVFTSLSSLIDGAKIFSYSSRGDIDKINVGGHGRNALLKVPSRSKKKMHNVALNLLPTGCGRKWYEFQAECQCEEYFFYKNSLNKYRNPEIRVCSHIVAGFYETMRVFHETEGNEHVSSLFPGPTEKILKFDEKLAKTFVKKEYKKRLNKAEREVLLCGYQGIEKNCFSFNLPSDWVQKIR